MFIGPATVDYVCFSGPSSLAFSAKSAILEVKGGENAIFSLGIMFRKGITFHMEKFISVTGSHI